MKSVKPWWAYDFMMCQRTGRSPIGIIGLGASSATSRMRVPIPPHKITTCMFFGPPDDSFSAPRTERGRASACRSARGINLPLLLRRQFKHVEPGAGAGPAENQAVLACLQPQLAGQDAR